VLSKSMTRCVLTILLVALLTCNAVFAKTKQALEEIATDLVVESFEFGKFPNGKDPHSVDPDKVVFIPVPSASEEGFAYGYRLKLKTSRPQILLNQAFDKSAKGLGWKAKPLDGIIYEEWPLDGVRNGQHKVTVWIEGKQLPTLLYNVKFRYN
jgi:hypothetical protein